MKYRVAVQSDLRGIESLCRKHNIDVPVNFQVLFVAIDSKNNIVGVSGIKTVHQIEPLISENPVVANNLFQRIEAVAQLNQMNPLRAVVKDDHHIKTFEKAGYKVIMENKTILEK